MGLLGLSSALLWEGGSWQWCFSWGSHALGSLWMSVARIQGGVTGRCFHTAVAHQGAINLGFKRSTEPEGGVSSLSHIAWKMFFCWRFCGSFVPPANSCHVLRIKVYLTVLPSETPILSLTQSWFQITFTPVKPNKLFKTLPWFTRGCVIQSL
ncbi:hypothetical protein AMECASPLE_026812, partial [Ameca splendens]